MRGEPPHNYAPPFFRSASRKPVVFRWVNILKGCQRSEGLVGRIILAPPLRRGFVYNQTSL